MGFWSSILGFFKSIFSAAAKTAVGQVVEDISPIAVQVVEELHGDLLVGNSEKRQLARDRIEAVAKAQGKIVTHHAINIAIELALAVVKQGTVGAAGILLKPATQSK